MVETGTKKEGFLDRDVGWLAFGRLDAALQRLGVTLHGDTERWREQTKVSLEQTERTPNEEGVLIFILFSFLFSFMLLCGFIVFYFNFILNNIFIALVMNIVG
ncbi:hypothetical protein I3843_11G061800 [Carya illinoinensis]|nr:hypothetical protein I3843_11G061800 [Carya illinoinensis]